MEVLKVTRELLQAVFYVSDRTTESEHKDIASFANALRNRFKTTISTWEDVTPQEVRAALDPTNAQLNSEGINVVSPDVFRWHIAKKPQQQHRGSRPAQVYRPSANCLRRVHFEEDL
ncbi:hypothetical protein LTR22_024650 [Elasticomyces elasticus]|nr:hypothetical protein LTR22_024650 [Elasticomyces elasticus]KAK4906146.1 hypothetical protein LTR49_024660 [Elasticomyces elasticus]